MRNFIFFVFLSILSISIIFYYSNKKLSTKASGKEKILYLYTKYSPESLDPSDCQDYYTEFELRKVFECLYKFEERNNKLMVIPQIALKKPEVSEDGLKYTIELRNDVYFQDNKCFKRGKGKKLTSNDIKYTLLRIADPKNSNIAYKYIEGNIVGLEEWRKIQLKSQISDYDTEIEGIKIIDDSKIEISLIKPNADFLKILAMINFAIVPKEAVNYYLTQFSNNPVGTGPFKIENYSSKKKKYGFYRNNKYKKTKTDLSSPQISKLVTLVSQSNEEIEKMFLSKRLSLIEINDVVDVSTYKQGLLIKRLKNPALDILIFNLKKPIFNDVKIRQAISLSIDTEKYQKLENINSIIHSTQEKEYYNSFSTFDLSRAQQLTDEVFRKIKTKHLSITIDILDEDLSIQKANFIKQSLEKINISVDIRKNTQIELNNRINKGNYTMTIIQYHEKCKDPIGILNTLSKKYQIPEYLTTYSNTLKGKNISSMIGKKEIELHILEELPFIILEQKKIGFFMHPDIIVTDKNLEDDYYNYIQIN